MTEKEGKPEMTAEEKAKLMEARRQIALKNLAATHLQDLGSAYFVDESGEFGEAPNSAMEQFKYFPALNTTTATDLKTGKEYNILQNALLASRKGKKRYSGNAGEYDIIQQSANVLIESVASLKVEDLAKIGLLGEGALQEKYAGKYFAELGKEDQQAIMGSYQSWLSYNKVSEAMKESAGAVKKNLETLVLQPKEAPKEAH